MSRKPLSVLATAFLCTGLALAAPTSSQAQQKTLTAFASEQELSDLFKGWAEDYRKRMEAQQRSRRDSGQAMQAEVASKPASAPQALATAGALAKSSADESVTNVQHAGVDEGGIVRCTATTW